MLQSRAISLLMLTFAAFIGSTPLHTYQVSNECMVSALHQAEEFPIIGDGRASSETKELFEERSTLSVIHACHLNQRSPSKRTSYDSTQDRGITLRPSPALIARQGPAQIFWEIARVMRDPFADVYSIAISAGIIVALLQSISIIINAIRLTYSKQPRLSRFQMNIGDMNISPDSRKKKPIPWNSVENIMSNLADNANRGFIGLSRKMFRRNDIYSSADITVTEQFIFFAVSMGTVLLLFYGIDVDERGNFVG